ncbi:MAG TPA: YceI family protein [Thermoanaerobaculia bacterium]|nr:YceI family protein [Thermoanaerobaculia bacterium]
MNVSRRALLVLFAAFAAIAETPARAEQRVLVLDPAASKVSFTLSATGHQVEGTMAVKSGRVSFDPATGAASGEIVLDLKSAQTGSDGRDEDMHEKVLETGKYPVAVFRAEKVRGTLAPSGPSDVTLDGTLSFHGSDHKMSLPAKVDVQNGRVKADTKLQIPYVAWGLHDPSVFVLRVGKVVDVKVHAVGSLEADSGSAGTP